MPSTEIALHRSWLCRTGTLALNIQPNPTIILPVVQKKKKENKVEATTGRNAVLYDSTTVLHGCGKRIERLGGRTVIESPLNVPDNWIGLFRLQFLV